MAKRFQDPHRGGDFTFRTVSVEQIEVIGHQRKVRPAHIKNLTASIDRIGFVVPLVAVEKRSGGKTAYVVIDGQHRFQAAKDLGVTEFPVIVVPGEIATRMMNLNIEKDLNIREKAYVALAIYRDFLEESPSMSETNEEIVDSLENARYVALGLAYEKSGRLAGSAFEPILKKSDGFLNRTLDKAYEVRQERAGKILEASNLIKSITAKIKEMGRWHSFLTPQIMSYANPFKRKRGKVDFDEAFAGLIKKLEQLVDSPGKVLKEPIG